MKQRFVWVLTLLLGLLLVVAASCAPAATPAPTPAPAPATPTTTDTTNSVPAIPPISMQRQRTSGTISKINGDILTLTTAQGQVTVKISSDNTTIQNFMTGTIADLHEGQSLNVMGPQDANGNVSANYIIIQPQGRGTTPTPPSGS